MVKHIVDQLAAHGANVTPNRTSGRGAAAKPAESKKPAKSDPSDEMTSPQIQAARRQVVGYGYRADTNTTFGVPVYVRTYRLLHEAEAARMDELFYQITNTQP